MLLSGFWASGSVLRGSALRGRVVPRDERYYNTCIIKASFYPSLTSFGFEIYIHVILKIIIIIIRH
jgi:hypothetical protein